MAAEENGRGSSGSSSTATGLVVYVGNIPKAATEDQLRKFFHLSKGIVDFCFRLEDCTYCPTKIAFIKFAKRESDVYRLNQTFFQGKRILVLSVDSDRNFKPRYTVMVKQLNEYITEADVFDHFKHIGSIECVQKPAANYAYVSFDRSENTQRALNIKSRKLKGVDIEVFPVKRYISMIIEKQTLLTYADIRQKCDALGLRYDPEAETQTKLLVTNIPRDVPSEEVLDYLSKFGKVVDWEMKKSPMSVLTNIGFVTYLDPKTARFVYLYAPHNFQGVVLDIYNTKITYGEVKSITAVLLKRTNVYITNDEIYQAMDECGRVEYIHRVDSTRYCTIVRFKSPSAVPQALKIKRIADENVYVTKYTEDSYLTDISPIPETVPKSRLRVKKESMLQKMIEEEDLAEQTRLRTVPNIKYSSPNPEFYRNEVKVTNYPVGTRLIQFRDFFKKCGNVINFREVINAGFIGEAFLSFDTRLEARRACTLNQNFMSGKRLLIHMADEGLILDPELCVKVAGLNSQDSDEDIYDRFSDIGSVKFVHRQSDKIAFVCMEKKRWIDAALRVVLVNKHKVIISRVDGLDTAESSEGPSKPQQSGQSSYLPTRPNLRPIDLGRPNKQGPRPMGSGGPRSMGSGGPRSMGPGGPGPMGPGGYMGGPNGPMMGPGGPMGPNGHMMGPDGQMMGSGDHMMGPGGPMMGPGGPMMGPGDHMMGPGGPMMGPGDHMMGPADYMMGPGDHMMGPGGPMMGPRGPMMHPGRPMMHPGGPMRPHGPMMGPRGPMMRPRGPMMGPRGPPMGSGGPRMGPGGPPMGLGGPMNQNLPIVTPAMRRLMRMIESEMINIEAFSSLPKIEQFRLVHGIVNQFIHYSPQFDDMTPDDKIRSLMSGQNGFAYANTFMLFTYPQQMQLLALIQQDYWNTISSTPVPEIMEESVPDPIMQSDPVVVNPDPASMEEEEIPDPMVGEDIVAPWPVESSHPPTPTKTTPDSSIYDTIPLTAEDRLETRTTHDSSIYDTIPLTAEDRFVTAEKLDVEPKNTKNTDKAMSISSDSDSEGIPPAPEPPKFSTTEASSISPLTLPARRSRTRSRSRVDSHRRSSSQSNSRKRSSRSPRKRQSRSRSVSRKRLSRSPKRRSPQKRRSRSRSVSRRRVSRSPKRRSPQKRRSRSRSVSRRRVSRSPKRRSPQKRRSRSRSVSRRRLSRSPKRRSPQKRRSRSRSDYRRRLSRSPKRRSPHKRRSRSRSVSRRRLSRSPKRRSPQKRRSRSRSVRRRLSRSPKRRSPQKRRSRSRSVSRKRLSRSPKRKSPQKHRSRSRSVSRKRSSHSPKRRSPQKRRSKSQSVSRKRLSHSPKRSPRKRDSLSPFSKALLSSPLLRYDRSVSDSPELSSPKLSTVHRSETTSRDKERRSPIPTHRSPSPSPNKNTHQHRDRQRPVDRRPARKSRSKSESPLSLSPPAKSPALQLWDDPSVPKQPPRYPFGAYKGKQSFCTLFVGNLPLDTTEEQMLEIFGKYGQIVSLSFAPQNIGTKRAYISFDTYEQGLKALGMHLKQYRGHLLRVAFKNVRAKERRGYSVVVKIAGKVCDEIALYNTFKLCGDITYLWTRFTNPYNSNVGKAYGVIDFKHRDAVRAALETDKLVNGKRCSVAPIV